jgi:predicted DNA binding protein
MSGNYWNQNLKYVGNYLRDVMRRACLNIYSDCEVAKAISVDDNAKIIDLRFDGNYVRHLASVPIKTFKKSLINVQSVKLELIKICGNYCILGIVKNPCTVCRVLLRENIFMIDAYMYKPNYIVFKFICSSKSLAEIRNKLKELGIDFTLTLDDNTKGSLPLTDEQERLIRMAYELGYFDFPKRITLKELSRITGLSLSTINEVLRRGLKRVISSYIQGSI